MYGKIFASMFKGSLYGHWEAIVTFTAMIALADEHGEVDMTAEALAAVTSFPLAIVQKGIAQLEQPDPASRTPTEEGRRLVRVSDHRAWGWRIVNYEQYRQLRSQAERREYMKQYQRKRRAPGKAPAEDAPVNPEVNSVNNLLTPVNNLLTPVSNVNQSRSRSRGISRSKSKRASEQPPPLARSLDRPPAGELDNPLRTAPALTGRLLLVTAANRGILDAYHGHANPILANNGHTHMTCEAFETAGVDFEFAAGVILAKARTLTAARPPGHLSYFRQLVLDAWEREVALRQAATYQPGTPPAVVLALHRDAIGYAKRGVPEWIDFCTEHHLDYGAA